MLALALTGWAPLALAAPLATQPCRLPGLAHEARCATLNRPLDPARPDGPQVQLHLAVLPALARHPKPDPVLFFAGGPGQSALDLAPQVQALLGRLPTRRDLVLIDQRGTGRSAPLTCEDKTDPTRPLARALDGEAERQRLRECRQRLQALPHGDLRFYTTDLASQDAEAVRQALGLGPVNVVGVSYGTRVALDYQRQFPASVRRVVLDGVAPPGMGLAQSMAEDSQAAFDALLANAEASQPGTAAAWQALLAGLPQRATVRHPLTGREESLRLERDAVAAMVRPALYQPAMAAALPAAIRRAAAGDFGPLLTLGGSLSAGSRPMLAEGEHFSVVCAEDPLPADARATQPVGQASLRLYREVCADWPRRPLPADHAQLPPARRPVLLLSGGQDPVTPPRHAQRVAEALGPQAVQLLAPQAGHGLLGLACVREAVQRFIEQDDDTAALARAREDADCAAKLPRPLPFQPLAESAR